MTDSPHKQRLIATRELLSDERRWTQFTRAKTELGNDVSPNSSRAVCWCLEGGYMKNGGEPYLSDDGWVLIESATFEVHSFTEPFQVNDILGHAAVLKVLDHAIEHA